MLTEMRKQIIMELLMKKGTVTVEEVANATGSSLATVRRDLTLMEKESKLKRVHGGAVIAHGIVHSHEKSVLDKRTVNKDSKQLIAKYAAEQITDEDFVFLDAGTTTAYLIDYLPNRVNATFVTNGVAHANSLVQKGIKTFIVGGEVKQVTEAIVGSVAGQFLEQFYFTKAFLGANGISIEAGFTTPDPNEAFIKQIVTERAASIYVLADYSKFDKVYPMQFATIDRCGIITDVLGNPKIADYTFVKEVSKE